jgi:ADP-ribosylglycohydrolase
LIGGAVGDALGAPVEFMSHHQIVREFGPDGIKDYVPAFGRLGAITDDTQMTLFTAEGLLRGFVRGCVRGIVSYEGVVDHAYQRWLLTQGESSLNKDVRRDGWLWKHKDLHSRRAPGLTCLSAMRSKLKFGDMANNDSKGCGGVMRVAPVGMFAWHERNHEGTGRRCFELGCGVSGLTHGHITGKLTAGVFAVLVFELLQGNTLERALFHAKRLLDDGAPRQSADGFDQRAVEYAETWSAIEHAIQLAASPEKPSPHQVAKLGEGWVAEEALAISIYCALVARDFEEGVSLAVNHSGDSDSTGAITGNLLGASLGVDAIPSRWKKPLELKRVINSLADDLYEYPGWSIAHSYDAEDNKRIYARYPGV